MASKQKCDCPDVAESKVRPQSNPELVKRLELAVQFQSMCALTELEQFCKERVEDRSVQMLR